MDHIHQVLPKTCKHCGGNVAKGEVTGSCVSHFVYELPRIKPTVHEYQLRDVACPDCGLVTAAKLPDDVPKGLYGPTVQAMTGMLRGELQTSVRQTSAVMTEVMGVPMSTGSVVKVQHQLSEIIAAPVDEAVQYVRDAAPKVPINADETSWREAKQKAWLWVAVAGSVIVFLIRRSRATKVAKELLGEFFKGILTTDRYGAYRWVDPSQRQICWSHLKRDFKSFLDYGGKARQLGEHLLRKRRLLFRYWNQARDGTLTRSELRLKTKRVQADIISLLEEGQDCGCAKVAGMCKEMLVLKDSLFTFIEAKGVEPTNNAAERALRFAVLWRKRSFGSDSEAGSRFVERILTVRATLRAQNRSLYEYLLSACEAALNGRRASSILPSSLLQEIRRQPVAA